MSAGATTVSPRLGREVAVAEARRLNEMLSHARATKLIPRKL